MRRLAIFSFAVVLMSCGQPSHSGAQTEPAPPTPIVVTATPESGGSLLEAFRVAYGGPAPLMLTSESGEELEFSPQAFVNIQPGVVALISKAETPGGGGCHACYGDLSIRYLRPEGNSFVVLSKWDGVGGAAPYGKATPWTIRTDIDDYPVMVLERQDGGMGCFHTLVSLVSLTPTGPRSIATDISTMAEYQIGEGEDPSRGWKIEGRIVPIKRGREFHVERTGLRTTPVIFRRAGDVFLGINEGDVPSC